MGRPRLAKWASIGAYTLPEKVEIREATQSAVFLPMISKGLFKNDYRPLYFEDLG